MAKGRKDGPQEEKGNVLGDNLRKFRQARKQKQEEVADALGVAAPTYSSWERGRTEPSIDALLKLAGYYNVSVDRLLSPESRSLRIGSYYPPFGEFHPIRSQAGLYTVIYRLVFNHLYFYDIYERRIHVELIDSWRVNRSDRKSSYTFYLRSSVKFHRGDDLDLRDVKYSYDLFLDLYSYWRKFIDDVEIREGENAIELKLSRWLELEYLPTPYIIPRSYGEDPVCFEGTGPFKLADVEQQKRLQGGLEQPVTLEANKEYFGVKKPAIPAIEFHRFDDEDKLKVSLGRGELDVGYNVELEEPTRFHIEYGRGVVLFYLVLYQDKFRDEDVSKEDLRKAAVDFAIDRNRIVELLGPNRAEPLFSHLHLILREKPSKEYNRAKAEEGFRQVMASLKDKEIAIPKLRIGASYLYDPTKRLVKEIVQQLKHADIDAEPAWDNRAEANASVEILTFNSPLAVHLTLYSSNQFRYSNPYVDSLLDNVDISTYRQIQGILSAERFFLPLASQSVAITHTKALETNGRLRATNALYAPDVVHWEFNPV